MVYNLFISSNSFFASNFSVVGDFKAQEIPAISTLLKLFPYYIYPPMVKRFVAALLYPAKAYNSAQANHRLGL